MENTPPLQIYLDSSDYSNLSSDQYSAELESLKSLVDKKAIEVRYSNVTIAELIHTEKEHQHYAIGRAKVLRTLCGKKCLIYNDILLFHDCLVALAGKDSRIEFPNYAYNDRSHWYPPKAGSFQNFKAELAKDVTERIRTEINRHPDPTERKSLRKKLKRFIRNGNFTSEGLAFTKGMDAAVIEKFAFLDKTKPAEMLRKHLVGKISYRELQDYLLENGADPANLAEFTIDQVEDGLSKFQWLRKGGVSFIDYAKQLVSLADKIEKSDKECGIHRSRKEIADEYGLDFSNLRQKMLKDCWSNYKHDFCKRNITHSNFMRLCESAELGTFPSLDILVEIMPAYTEQLITKNRTKLLSSDFGDIAHAMYLPYVDVFRADRAMTHLFRSVGDKYQTKVIRTLKELVSELNKIVPN
jgi:hypothetical protein